MRFTKMHGLGNDYIFIYGDVPLDAPQLSKRLSERKMGVGADGLIFITPSEKADFGMRIFNADGSEGKMCGNGIRCLGKFVYENGLTQKKRITVETRAGIRTLCLLTKNERVECVSADMGIVRITGNRTLCINDENFALTVVDVGNPHAVIFTEHVEDVPLTTYGEKISKHESFAGGINVEFVQIMSPNMLRMRVYERGSGVTMACGTGACAAAAAAIRRGACNFNEDIRVLLDGGVLLVRIAADGRTLLTGGATTVFDGEIT